MALPTYVKSLNGQTEPVWFKESGIKVHGDNIRVTGSSGSTVKQKCQSIASSMQTLTVSNISGDDYKISIGNYPLSL